MPLQAVCQPPGKHFFREEPGYPGGAAEVSNQCAHVAKAATAPWTALGRE